MAVRIRKNGIIICAAKSKPEKGDTYINDGLHYFLSVEIGVLSTRKKDKSGADIWEFHRRYNKYK